MTKETGGPAFPSAVLDAHTMTYNYIQGMTLRDYFAAKAMQSILGTGKYGGIIGVNNYEQRTAADAYKMADAMLKARGQ